MPFRTLFVTPKCSKKAWIGTGLGLGLVVVVLPPSRIRLFRENVNRLLLEMATAVTKRQLSWFTTVKLAAPTRSF